MVDTSPVFAPLKKAGMYPVGGPVWTAPNVYVIFDGSNWNSRDEPYSKDDLISAFNKIFKSHYFDALIQYGIKRPKLWKYVTNTTENLPSTFDSEDVANLIRDSISRGQVPSHKPYTNHNIYMVVAGYGKQIAGNSSVAGFHFIDPEDMSTEQKILETSVVGGVAKTHSSMSFNNVTETFFHEMVECMSDPMTGGNLAGWKVNTDVLSNANGNEICDPCESVQKKVDGVEVGPYFSNHDGTCVAPSSQPSWISCRPGQQWDNVSQSCKVTAGSSGTGSTPVPAEATKPAASPTNYTPSGTYEILGFTRGNVNGAIYFNTTSGYITGKANKNHAQCEANGFMQDVKDFRQVEISLYIKLTGSTGNGQFVTKVRGGASSGSGNCEGCGIGIALGYDGRYRAFKVRRYKDIVSFTSWQAGIGDIQGKWIGYKAIYYNVPNGVRYELYLDLNESNDWRKVYETTDTGEGSLGGAGSVCNGRVGQPILWGGPLIFMEWNLANDPDGLQLKKISIREINPAIRGDSSTRPPEFGTYVPGSPYNPGEPYVPPPFNPGNPYTPVDYNAGSPYVHPPYNPGDPYTKGPKYDPVTGTYPVYVPPATPSLADMSSGIYPLATVSEGGSAIDSTSGSGTGTPTGAVGSSGGGNASGDGLGSIGTGIDTPDTKEQQILYERKVFWIRYNINHKSGDPCGVGKQPANPPLENIWDIAGDVYVDGNLYTRCGMYVAFFDPNDASKSSMWINQRMRHISIVIKKEGTNTLAGNINIVIRDKDYQVVSTLGTIAASAITGNDQEFPISCSDNPRHFRKGDHLSVEYGGNTQNDYIRVKVSQVDKLDGQNTGMFVYDGSNVTTDKTKYHYDLFADFGAKISV